MSITLSDGTTTVSLPADLYWGDEHAWHPVLQSVERSLTGALIIDAATLQAGRPITLAPADETSAWMPLTTLEQLRTWADVPLKQLTLTIRGVAHTVIWRHDDPPALSAEPLVQFNDTLPSDWYLATLKFMKV